MHDDLGVRVENDVVALLLLETVPEKRVVGKLPVAAEGEPFVDAAVLPLEGLGIRAVIGAAGGVAHVADGGAAPAMRQNVRRLAAVPQPEGLVDRADLLVGDQEAPAGRVVARHPGGELAAHLHVEEQPGDEGRDVALGIGHAVLQGVNRGDTAFFSHGVFAPRMMADDPDGPRATEEHGPNRAIIAPCRAVFHSPSPV